jgi:hypothetical protein
MGIRTPDLLHAIQRQPVHPRVPVQVTVLPRPLRSGRVQACCGTFLLYPPALLLASGWCLAAQPYEFGSCLQNTVLLLCYRSYMAVRKKRSISLPPDLDAEIAAAAAQAGMTYSSWLAATARKEFAIRAGLAAVAQFEDEHGAFTPGELADADQWAAQAIERASQTGTTQRQRSA